MINLAAMAEVQMPANDQYTLSNGIVKYISSKW
jgi:hypothetical protein